MKLVFKFLLWCMNTFTTTHFAVYEERIRRAAINNALTVDREQRYNSRKSIERDYLNSMFGKRVIVFGNEWCDPIIGYLTSLAHDNIPGVVNALDGSTYYPFGKVFPYTENRLEVITSLTPTELWDFAYSCAGLGTYDTFECSDHGKDPDLLPHSVIVERLTANGFTTCETYNEFLQYQTNQPKNQNEENPQASN